MPSRLKSLELQGYKTFASRTEFVFAEMVTAIVGPNGSGKSNIADSLRWVLGEQSYSLLRAKKTEDMIFSGSEQRSRAGMASATITFDNSDGWLPIDFSEVAITRRAYRDGQNEYLLNGQRVRLRDVSELLAKSGLAERTYTIIGQGLVDAALALKAEERRRLFEEAAGIGLYRTRREESLKRLETTRRNLERVQDILAELQPRLRSLERQARRAVEYEQVKADLRVLLREFYGYHWHHAQEDLASARTAAAVQEESLEQIRQAQLGHDQKLFALREALQNLRENLSGLHRQSAALHTRREGLSRELAVAEERSRSLEAQRSLGQQEIARLEDETSLNQERLEAANREQAGLQAELDEARQQVESSRQVLQARQLERRKAEEELGEARQKLSGFTARQAHLEARQVEGQAQLERRRQALQKALQAGETAQDEHRQQAEKARSLQDALHECEVARQAVETELEAGRQQVLAIEQTRKKAQEVLGQRQAQAAGLHARLEVLEQAEASLAGYASGARVLLEAIRSAHLQGSPQALSAFLEVPENLETAIAAALGDFLDAVLLEGEANLEAALEILSKESARGALLPMDQLRAERPLSVDLSQAPGGAQAVLGVAASLLSASPDVTPAIQLLLGHVLVVRDRLAARQVISSLGKSAEALPPNLRLVTLKGEVFHLSGAILAGQEEHPSILSRPRQQRELNVDLDMIAGQVETLEEQIEAIRRQTDRIAEDEHRLQLELKARKEAENQAGDQLKAAQIALEKAARSLQWQVEQRSQLEADIAQRMAQVESIAAELDQLEQEVEGARENLRHRNQALADLSLDELQTQLSHWNTRAAVAERACEEAAKRQEERVTILQRARQSLAEQQARLAEIQRDLLSLEQTRRQYRQEEGQLNQEIELLQVQIEPAENELDQLDREQRVFLATDSEGRQALAQAEHRHAQARINLARRQETLDSLRRRIEDDFGLVAFDYDEAVSGPTPLPLSGMVESLPFVEEVSPELEEGIRRQRAQLRRMGAVNPEAQVEFQEVSERFKFLSDQVSDLNKAEEDIKEVIAELDLLMEREFRKTFDAVAQEFRQIFTRLFGGGSARLLLTDPDDMTDTGIDIEARLPGRREQGLSLLSGGERSLTAAALVFSLLRVSPTPFCVLDEVDAMLDEANVGRFRELLRELSQNTQFVVVTHNRNTVQAADVIYGVTMGHDSASQVVSLKLDEVSQAVV